ncbi:MAG: type I restriction endonuclease subunit R [Bdellovibrionales bacterium]|jgi:type I restriction enzyme, R subunit|nr:type I restriction endonuclease subunit R [Bdellovibrionales bacterium]MBT3525957.1 type I restriction endonuclease subunit R [Bdellovibrionales bacterium]MBT7669616.1 type I restriction endonuclease subunit R [Bdellovibrionales bacterium]
MATSQYKEDLSSLIPALHLLHNIGYKYLTPTEANNERDGKLNKAILEKTLTEQLRKINSIHFRGGKHSFSEGNIQKAVQAIAHIPFDSLINTNEQIYDLLTLGKSLEQTINGHTKSFSIQYIDWKNPENNVFHVTDEFVVERRHSNQTRRPDIVLFVNGLPLVVIECKRPDLRDALDQGISQNLRNQKSDEIPDLFTFSQVLMSVCQNKASYGTTGTPLDFWATWKEEDSEKQEECLKSIINIPLPTDIKDKIFSERDQEEQDYMQTMWDSGDRLPSPQDHAILSLLSKERLLELIYQFIVFDNKVKKICRYQQYFAIKATLNRVTDIKGDSRRQGGVIWHTTGSGKSLTMVMLAKALALHSQINNPKIVLVTDRVDLDDQIYKTFLACGKSVDKARSGEHLIDLIVHNKANIITTIIDKFESASKKRKIKDESHNIFVLVDESHRSQYGVAHAKMTNIFPKACYIGFTGTPLLKKEKSTANKFGGFIHKYTMNQAVKDGAVRPLVYEGRMSELRGDKEKIDKWFDRITEDLTDKQKVDLKKKFKREEELLKSEQRIAEVAFDIGIHFKENFKGTGKKGQLAVSSKENAIRYQKYFKDFGDVNSEVVISAPDTREDHTDIDESNVPEVQQFWKAMLSKYGSEKKYVEGVVKSFKHSEKPEILIVVDKLLTGFDAPRNAVLYIDKRLKEHNILQAIARVNRVFEGKDHGLVIDYRGIFGEISDAIDTYAALEKEGFDKEDVKGTLTNSNEEIALLSQRHSNVWSVFNEVENKNDIESMQRHLAPEDIRKNFYDALKLFGQTLQLALGNARFQDEVDEVKKKLYKDDLKMFLNLRSAVKQRYGETVDYSSYEKQIRNVVNKHIGAEEVKIIIEQVDIFAEDEFEKELSEIIGDAAKADTIASRMKRTINEKMDEDPALYKKLSEMISEAIAEHRAKRLSDNEYLKKMREALGELRGEAKSEIPDKLKGKDTQKAYFGVINQALPSTGNLGDDPSEIVADIAIRFDEIITKHKIRDWPRKQDIVNQMFNEMEDHLFSIKGRFELELDYDQIDSILEQIIMIAKRREGN